MWLIKKLWSVRAEFIKYFVIGFSAFILDVGSLYLLKQHIGLRPTFAVIINQPFLLTYVFYLNKHWSFKSAGFTHTQMIRFLMLTTMNYIISALWMWFFNEKMGIHRYLFLRTANIALAVAWNFLLYKYWVYRMPVTHNT